MDVCSASSIVGFGHLAFTTSDGALFAYHKAGVLRLWKSEPNNMELQVRTLTPAGIDCEATLIGQVRRALAPSMFLLLVIVSRPPTYRKGFAASLSESTG